MPPGDRTYVYRYPGPKTADAPSSLTGGGSAHAGTVDADIAGALTAELNSLQQARATDRAELLRLRVIARVARCALEAWAHGAGTREQMATLRHVLDTAGE